MVDFLARAEHLFRGAATELTWSPSTPKSIVDAIERRARRNGDQVFLEFEGQRWSAREFDATVNRHAHAWRAHGLTQGDVVAIVMGNAPAYLFHLYGLAKLGVVAALINPKLTRAPLRHALTEARPRAIVADPPAAVAVAETGELSGLTPPPMVFVDASAHPSAPPVTSMKAWVPAAKTTAPAGVVRRMGEVMAYIYTSGTTGKPKPAVVKHHRFYRGGLGGAVGLGLEPGDGVFNCLPLYHANGVLIAASSAICGDARLILSRRFSASSFWPEVVASGATHFVYIGEVCRYLLNAPPHPLERSHRLRLAIGNGLRADVWRGFQQRFKIPRIVEFYGSTEGNAETVNLTGTPGSCGVLLPHKMALVRCDETTGELVLGDGGWAQRCRPGEPGLLLGRITANNEFPGYRDKKASRQKTLTHVFKSGDAWFNTGDLLKRDRLFRLYFVDRLGDTYRWKGENVSTTEVAEVIGGCRGVKECAVYGVQVPGHEGRAGMAALVIDDSFEISALATHIREQLPAYARPRFLRVVQAMAITGTFKHSKGELKREGYRFPGAEHSVFAARTSKGTYAFFALDEDVLDAIAEGRWPL